MARRFLVGQGPTAGSGTSSRPPNPVTGQEHFRTDKGFTETYDGTAWRVLGMASVAALADIQNPITGQLAFLTGTKILYRWTGSAWQAVDSLGAVARWNATGTGQTISANTDTKLQFNTAQQTNTDVVTAGGTNNDTFTAVLTGTLEVEVGCRHTNTAAMMELSVYSPGNAAFSLAAVQLVSGGGGRSAGVSGHIPLTAGDTFAVNAWSGAGGGSVDTSWGKATHISVRFAGP